MAGLFGRKPTLLPTRKMKEVQLPASIYPFVEGGSEGHQQQWVKACKKGFGTYTSSSFEVAGPLTETVLMGNLAIRSYNYSEKDSKGKVIYPGRKKLLWDGGAMKCRTSNRQINLLSGSTGEVTGSTFDNDDLLLT
jgi:hypothetical protein